jgi:hypothetical protein
MAVTGDDVRLHALNVKKHAYSAETHVSGVAVSE